MSALPATPDHPPTPVAVVGPTGPDRTVEVRVTGYVAHPAGPRELRRCLRRVARALPSTGRTVLVDLGGLDLVTVDAVVVLCLERQQLAARTVDLRVRLPPDVPVTAGAEHLLATLPLHTGRDRAGGPLGPRRRLP